jgi:hypothetical protein
MQRWPRKNVRVWDEEYYALLYDVCRQDCLQLFAAFAGIHVATDGVFPS